MSGKGTGTRKLVASFSQASDEDFFERIAVPHFTLVEALGLPEHKRALRHLLIKELAMAKASTAFSALISKELRKLAVGVRSELAMRWWDNYLNAAEDFAAVVVRRPEFAGDVQDERDIEKLALCRYRMAFDHLMREAFS